MFVERDNKGKVISWFAAKQYEGQEFVTGEKPQIDAAPVLRDDAINAALAWLANDPAAPDALKEWAAAYGVRER